MGKTKDHKKLCKLVKKDYHKTNLKEYSELVKYPRYICQKCGHAAAEAKSLCKPAKLE
ncbi:MAG: hypothetical protein K9N09_04735 [Candidatus Cloacimonetes bacterium]|nr:hypothetical protein [Candidatus Cloacimonadota bacterium]MCF7815066.1 hypothetical protein [Candidatus Cloacimonadota bacterium]MCF7867988.1 hypothetical protein [Candidatus Cloacimonadota bacterium]MCF7883446.1 hypothetical protein [Candidatus Cloacimonadota bacterium]